MSVSEEFFECSARPFSRVSRAILSAGARLGRDFHLSDSDMIHVSLLIML